MEKHTKCAGFGIMTDSHHDEWFTECKEHMKKFKKSNESGGSGGDKKQGELPSMPAATFCRPILKVLHDPHDSDASF